MNYSPANSYMWDFWLVKKKGFYHIYYLQAPRNIQNPDVRHSVASVGHAVSKDLEIWKEERTVLKAGKEGSWDDTSIWTGSIIEKNDKYYMFYTSRSKREAGKIQRIGVAISEDLSHHRLEHCIINQKRFLVNSLRWATKRFYLVRRHKPILQGLLKICMVIM